VRAAVVEDTLEAHVLPYLQEELLSIRSRFSKENLLARSERLPGADGSARN
jgi:hypothetical protein